MSKSGGTNNVLKYLSYGFVIVAFVYVIIKYILPWTRNIINNVKTKISGVSLSSPDTKGNSFHLHDEESYEKLLRENPRLARQWFIRFYENAMNSQYVLDTDSQRRAYESWLREELKEALSTQNYRKNLYEWLSGQVETPEASIVLNFLKYLQKDSIDFTREVIERLAKEFNESFSGRPELKTLPSVMERVVQTSSYEIKTVI